MNSDAPEEKVVIELSRAAAIVLFEFLWRFSTDHHHKLEIQDQAEERVLWDMCCDLEKALVEPLRPDYTDLLQRARDSIRDKLD